MQSRAHIIHRRDIRETIQGMDSKKAEDLKRIRAENLAESEARIQVSKSFARGMSVQIHDGRVGKVSSVNQRTGSIEVSGRVFRRPEWHSATTLKKL